MGWVEVIGIWFAKGWSKIKIYAAVAAAAIGSVFLLIFKHKRDVRRADREGERRGVEEEQKRIDTAAAQESERMKERADEVHQKSADRSDDDLRDRLRDQSRRHGPGNR